MDKFKELNRSMPPTQTRKKERIRKVASCIRKTSNTARISRKYVIDSEEFTSDVYSKVKSSKYAALVQKIKSLDAEDLTNYGTKFKHFIFTDIREGAYGAKAIAGFLVAGGFDFRMKHATRTIRRGGKEIQTKHGMTQLDEKPGVYGGSDGFAMLQSLPLWKNPLPAETKKRILTVFNSRPDNVHGELLRIIVLDSKFKEGIDLFDVKYVHLMEPTIATSDLKQAVGRATRFCGQRGLHFVPQRGWPLQVYIYKTLLPQREPFILPNKTPLIGSALQKGTNEMFAAARGEPHIIESVDAHELMLAHSGLDLALINTTKELTILAILSAVDYDLNYKINNFTAEPVVLTDVADAVLEVPTNLSQSGGAAVHFMEDLTPEILRKCERRKSKLFPFTKARMVEFAKKLGIRAPRNAKRTWYCHALLEYPELYKALVENKLPVRRPLPTPFPKQIETPVSDIAHERLRELFPPSANTNFMASPSATEIAYERLRELFPPPANTNFEPLSVSVSEMNKVLKKIDTTADFATFQTQIRAMYERFAWDSPIVENGCTSSAIVQPGTPVTFTRTQDFIRHYLTPESPFKGLLAWHSVGTGKTCMAVAAATTEFERAGYTILWVTRNALMADVYKNIFGAVCSIPIADSVRSGTSIPSDRAAQLRMLGRQWIKPISYKMFQNALEKGNELGRQLWKQSPTDPLARTFLVIDEIHKLRDGDLSASEFADFSIIQKFIHKSYEVSGNNSVRPLLMTATPISDSPGELFDILNTLIPTPKQRLMNFFEFRRKFTNGAGEINSDGRDYFQDRVKGLISYLNREYDPTTFAQPEFHTIALPAGEIKPPTTANIVNQCLAGVEPLPKATTDDEAALKHTLDAELARAAELPKATERKKAEAAARKTYKHAVTAANKTRKARLNGALKSARDCHKKLRNEYKKVAESVQMAAIESCLTGKKTSESTKFPSVSEFNTELKMRLEHGKDSEERNESNIESIGAVVNSNIPS
jgi:hypothetical protein